MVETCINSLTERLARTNAVIYCRQQMKNRSRYLNLFLAVSCLFIFGCVFIPVHIPKPESDVPVTSSIGDWNSQWQNALQIDDLQVEAVNPQLWFTNNRALVRFRIKGHIRWEYGQAYIQSVHISQRMVTKDGVKKKDIKNYTARNYVYNRIVELFPIVAFRKGKPLEGNPFDIKVERIFQTFGMGPNKYLIRCLDKEVTLTLHQMK